MKKHLCQKIYDNSVKKGSLWYLRWGHSLLPPPQLGKAKTPLRTGGAKDAGLPLSQLPVRGFSSLEEPDISILPQLPSAEAKL